MFFFPPSDVFPPVFTSEFLQMSAIDFFYFRISCHGVLVDDLGMYMYPPQPTPPFPLNFPRPSPPAASFVFLSSPLCHLRF